MRKSALVVLLLAPAACAIPSRDNPSDRTQAPNALLAVAVNADTAGCATVVTTSGWDVVATASRGACLALDARASTDPQKHDLTFTYEVLRNGEWEDVLPADLITSIDNGRLAVLQPAFLRGLPVNPGAVRFRVTARDASDGGHHDAETTFVLQNSRPHAVGDPTRTFPADGMPWAPGQPIDVSFDCSRSFDPDGDPLTCCWTQAGATVPACAERPARAHIAFPAGEPRSEWVTLSVDDHSGEPPAPGGALVEFGGDVVWSEAARTAGLVLARVDTERGDYASVAADKTGAVLLEEPGRSIVYTSQNGDLVVRDWPDFATEIAPRMTYGPNKLDAPAMAIDESRQKLWLYAFDAEDAPIKSRIERWTIAATNGALTLDATLSFTEAMPLFGNSELVVADDGSAWFARVLGTALNIATVDAGGAMQLDPPVFTLASGREIRSLTQRPGTQELWLAEVAQPGASTGIPASPTIHVFDLSGVAAPRAFEMPLDDIRRMGFGAADALWVAVTGVEIRLVDADLLDAGVSLDAATTFSYPIDSFPTALLPDLRDGGLWAELASPSVVHLSRSGAAHEYPGTDPVFPMVLDRNGAVLFEDLAGEETTLRGLSPDLRGAAFYIPKLAPTIASHTEAGNLLWSYAPLVGFATVHGSDGDEAARFSRVKIDGGEQPFPNSTAIAATPDGRYLWLLEQDVFTLLPRGLERYDLEADLLPSRTAADPAFDASVAASIDSCGSLLLPSAPVPASTPFVWTVLGEPGVGDATVAMIPETGAPLPVLALPANEVRRFAGTAARVAPQYFQDGARSLATNDLCLATMRDDGVLQVRWFAPSGAAPLSLTTGLTPVAAPALVSPYHGSVAGASIGPASGSGELCWVAYHDHTGTACTTGLNQSGDSFVLAIDQAGAVVHRMDGVEGLASGIRAVGPDEAWLSVYRCGTDFDTWLHVTLGTSGSLVLTTSGALGPTSTRGFLQP